LSEYVNALLLGVIQGLTEFLPVSSSGHLVIAKNLLGVQETGILFEVAVHLGTLLSIFTVYFGFVKKFFTGLSLGLKKKKMNHSLRIVFLLFVATLPAAFVGLLFKEGIESLFNSTSVVGIGLIFTGSILFLAQKLSKKVSAGSSHEGTSSYLQSLDLKIAEEISFKQALKMGLAQAIAILPGVSRSGSTIAAGLLSGLEKNVAATFSFMMSVPAVLGAVILQIRHINEIPFDQLGVLLFGILVSYLIGLLGLYLVLKVVNKGRLEVFSYYLWILGPLTLIYL
jgi:undecaprenyl-diphosphatase